MALGECHLLPWEFWRLTPGEFGVILEGFERASDRQWQQTAALGVWVLAPHSKKKWTIEKLLGRPLRLTPRSHGPR